MVGIGLIGTVVVTVGIDVVVTGGTDVEGVLGEFSTFCFRDRIAVMTEA